MKIGDIEIKGHVILGPMAGVTTLAYREFMKPFGVGLSYSEMISDCGISYGNKRTIEYLETSNVDRPVGLQLFGFDIKHAVTAIEYLEKNAEYDILDINLGCPVYKVTKTGAGSAWLKDPKKLFAYMKEFVSHSHKPVTAKIRLGWDSNSINVFEVAKGLEECGVKAISVHCRTSKQGYAGTSDYEAIRGLKETLNIPLIVSGDIYTPEDALRAKEITNCDAIMVARGGLGNPFLVTQINQILDTGKYDPSPDVLTQVEYAKDFASRLIEQKGEQIAIRELRGLIPHFFSGFPGYKKVRCQIATLIETKDDLWKLLDGISRRKSL
ncbi:MAG: tRNA dihydrouridine synthase DusB [Bacilli bacterium]|nr:tRNA dihydrouridine synthase DusB [Bacilli bacterium]